MEYTTVSDPDNILLFKTIDKRGLYYCEAYYDLQLGQPSTNDSGIFEITRNRDSGNRSSTFNYVAN